MPPKRNKEEAPKERVILGRFSNNLKMGIDGLPNVGKSTFFNTLTKLNVGAENYPFCTIEPTKRASRCLTSASIGSSTTGSLPPRSPPFSTSGISRDW